MPADTAHAPPRKDGRRLRREHSRRVVTGSVLELIRATGRVPTVQEVATRAGVTERTVFNLFEDGTALMHAGVAAFREEALSRLPEVPAGGTMEQRLHLYFARLAPFLEDYSRIRWAALTARTPVPQIGRGVVLEATFQRLVEVLGTDGARVQRDPSLTAALRAAVDPTTWHLYRAQQRLSVKAASAAMVLAVVSLVSGPERSVQKVDP